MSWKAYGLASLRILLTVHAVVTSVWGALPPAGSIALGVLGIVSTVSQTSWMAQRRRLGQAGLGLATISSVVVLMAMFKVSLGLPWDSYYSLLAGLMAATMLPPNGFLGDSALKTGWKILGMAWAGIGSFLWLAGSYAGNSLPSFYLGLLTALIFLMACKVWFRMPGFLILTINVLILLLISLPVADWLTRSRPDQTKMPGPRDKLFLFEKATKDPGRFARWCSAFDVEWQKEVRDLFVPDPDNLIGFHLKPGSHTTFFQSFISLNSRGFRGKEIAADKGNAYRIVAVGESTTFGITMNADDQPWPEVLEELINQRLKPSRPVEVINAGVPLYNLEANLQRLPSAILPLQPDMIISYHGYNGFNLIEGVVPLSNTLNPPVYRVRPLKLLADCEYQLKLFLARQRERRMLDLHSSSFVRPLETDYARAYQRLIQLAQTNHIRLVLADYSMAVNDQSRFDVINFYRRRFPSVIWWIEINKIHSFIVRELARQCPEVVFVTTHPHLDGDHGQFIDLMHFTQDGRRRLAENIFAGITNTLEQDLSRPRSQTPAGGETLH